MSFLNLSIAEGEEKSSNEVLKDARNRLKTDIEDVRMSINRLINLGIIVNEIVTNSLKHAFNPDRLKASKSPAPDSDYTPSNLRMGEDRAQLTLSDNGSGFPADSSNECTVKKSSSLELSTIEMLTAQIEASMERSSNPGGTTYTFQFNVLS